MATTQPLLLTDTELREITNRARPSAQLRALRAMGIPHAVRPDGTLAVARAYIYQLLSGASGATSRAVRATEPDWAALKR